MSDRIRHATRRRASRRDRAYATITAVLFIGIVATCLSAVGMLLSAEVRRTRRASEEAQLREMLRAGALIARDRATANAEFAGDASVPAALGTLTIEGRPRLVRDVQPTSPVPYDALITAKLPAPAGATGEAALPRIASERVALEQNAGAWNVTRAELVRQR